MVKRKLYNYLLGSGIDNYARIQRSEIDNYARMQRSEIDNYARMQRTEGSMDDTKFYQNVKSMLPGELGKMNTEINEVYSNNEHPVNPEFYTR